MNDDAVIALERCDDPLPMVTDDIPAELRDLVAAAAQSGVRVRMAEAEHMLDLSAVARAATRRRIGKRSALEVCAQLLNMTRQTLQPYAVIASRWGSVELRRLLELRGANGRLLSPSHLLAVARLPRGSRDSWIDRILRDGLDAQALRQQLRSVTASDRT